MPHHQASPTSRYPPPPTKSNLASPTSSRPSKSVALHLPTNSNEPSFHLPYETPHDEHLLNQAHKFYQEAFDKERHQFHQSQRELQQKGKDYLQQISQSHQEEREKYQDDLIEKQIMWRQEVKNAEQLCEQKVKYEKDQAIKQQSQAFATEKAEMQAQIAALSPLKQQVKELRRQLREKNQERYQDELIEKQIMWRQEVKNAEQSCDEKAKQEKEKISQAFATEKAEMQARITALSRPPAPPPPALTLSPISAIETPPSPSFPPVKHENPALLPPRLAFSPVMTIETPPSPAFTPVKHEKAAPLSTPPASAPPSPVLPASSPVSSTKKQEKPSYAAIAAAPPSPPATPQTSTRPSPSPLLPTSSHVSTTEKREKPYMTINQLFAKFGSIWSSAPCSVQKWPIRSPHLKSSRHARLRTPNSDQSEALLAAASSAVPSTPSSPSPPPRTPPRQPQSAAPHWSPPALSASSLPWALRKSLEDTHGESSMVHLLEALLHVVRDKGHGIYDSRIQ